MLVSFHICLQNVNQRTKRYRNEQKKKTKFQNAIPKTIFLFIYSLGIFIINFFSYEGDKLQGYWLCVIFYVLVANDPCNYNKNPELDTSSYKISECVSAKFWLTFQLFSSVPWILQIETLTFTIHTKLGKNLLLIKYYYTYKSHENDYVRSIFGQLLNL